MAPLCPFLEPSLSPQVSLLEASIPVSSRRLTSSSEHSVFCHPPARILYYTGRTISLFSCTMYPYQSTRKYASRGLGDRSRKICITRTRLVIDRRVSLSLSSPRVLPLGPSNHWSSVPPPAPGHQQIGETRIQDYRGIDGA